MVEEKKDKKEKEQLEPAEEIAKKLLDEVAAGRRVWNLDGVNYITKLPTVQQNRMADYYYSQAFSSSISDPDPKKRLLPRNKLLNWLDENDLWTKETQKQYDDIGEEIAKLEDQLAKYDASSPNQTSKELAERLVAARYLRMMLAAELNQYLNNSAELKADETKLDYLVSVCTYKEDESPVWNTFDDFENATAGPLVERSRYEYITFTQNISSDFMEEFPERKFLEEQEQEAEKALETDKEEVPQDKEPVVKEAGGKKSRTKAAVEETSELPDSPGKKNEVGQ